MTNKQIKQTLFAMCAVALLTTGCSNELPTSGVDNGNGEENTTVSFNLGLPGGDEVNYTRADVLEDDATEWTIKTLKVYHFSAAVTSSLGDADYTLVKAYDVPVKTTGDASEKAGSGECVNYGDGSYNLRLSLRSSAVGAANRHKFIIVANDACSTFDESLETAAEGSVTLSALKGCIADKQLNNDNNAADLFMGSIGGLCMTGESGDLELTRGHNDQTTAAITLERIMARLDVKSFVSSSNVFELKSVALKYVNNRISSKGYLFEPGVYTAANNICYDDSRASATLTQNSKYNEIGFPDFESFQSAQDWVAKTTISVSQGSQTVSRNGTWYKKVLYMYPFPIVVGGRNIPLADTPKLLINYTLNGAPGSREIELQDANKLSFAIVHNYVYTLQVGDPNGASEELSFNFTFTPWTEHEIDADLNEGTDVI